LEARYAGQGQVRIEVVEVATGHSRTSKAKMVGEEDLRKEEKTGLQGGEDAEEKEGRRTGAVLEQTAESEQ
jgi:hypothetical protein